MNLQNYNFFRHHAAFWRFFLSCNHHRGALRPCGEWLQKTIRFPIFWIVLNVGCNSVQFVCVPDNMVMKSGLPRKWNVVQVGISGNGGFDAADTHGQPSLLC
ncbi:MAG: hypothetical protein J6T56_05475, partial [Bacteroidales bacterium]|nr:hypothetical protein [Bacteroidales bacterium]